MAANTYLSSLRVGSNTASIGPILFGVCNTYSRLADKEVISSEFDSLEPGVHISVRFLNGCKQINGITLKVGAADPIPVQGTCICGANETLTFVYEQTGATTATGSWRVIGHQISPSDETPTPVGRASAGTSDQYARADHTHNLDMTEIASLVNGNFISKDIIQDPYDMFYATDRDTVVRLAANNTTTKKFLRSLGISQNVEENGELITEVVTTAPVWEALTSADVGLSNVTNHKQVTDVIYNNSTGAVTVTKGDDSPITLFTLGSNAFLSTAYLPLEGGKLIGPLSFGSASNTLLWENLGKQQRLVVIPSADAEDGVFTFAQTSGNTWTDLFVIRGNGDVTARVFIGRLNGNADTASALLHENINNTSINDTNGSFAFSGNGAPWINKNWVGLQIGDDNLRFQIVNNNNAIVLRTYNGSTWTEWDSILTESVITSGDNNGQIKVGTTNINVTGLGALAFENTVSLTNLPDLSNLYVTIDTDQIITGIKTFGNIMFASPNSNEHNGILFQGRNDFAAIKYSENNNIGHLRISLTKSNDIPIEFAWKRIQDNTEQIIHQFTSTEYIFNPLQELNNTYNSITIRPGITEHGNIGTALYKWAQMYAVEFYGALKGNADTATSALQDGNGLQINTNYLKLDGDVMRGTITTQFPINQVITNGVFTDAIDYGPSASPHRYRPQLWSFNANITPTTGDIITIRTPSAGHENGVYLSTDNGLYYYPITLNNNDPLVDQYPIGTCLTLIFDASNSALNIFALTGSDTRQNVSGGTWRVINYYDSGAPYGIRVYKNAITGNHEYPILMSQLMFDEIVETPYMNNVYALLNDDSTKVPTINPNTGIITAYGFNGPLEGAASSAAEFTTAATVSLTGHITGISAPSTRGWTINTTIADNIITNSMLQGNITSDKIDNNVVKVFNQTDIVNLLNLNEFPINGFFSLKKYQDIPTAIGDRPFEGEGAFLTLTTPDNRAFMQLAGQEDRWLIRGLSDINASLNEVMWHNIVLEDLSGTTNHPWALSITGSANSAIRDGAGNIITDHYATNSRVSELLSATDALVFKGILDSSREYDDEGLQIYRNLPSEGYSAGWVYKVNNNDTYAGQICEIGDLIIAIADGPLVGNQVRPQDWTIAQSNLETAITGTGSRVVENSFAIFQTTSGKVITDTDNYLISLNHSDALAGINRVGAWDGLKITGFTYENAADLVGNIANEMSFGDAGPQIQFTDDDLSGAIIYNRHIDNSGLTATFHFVTESGQTAIKTDGLIIKQKMAIGIKNVDSTAVLKVVGVTDLQGSLIIKDATEAHLLQLQFIDDKCVFSTQDQIEFGNNIFVGGNIYPLTNNFYTLGLSKNNELITWHAVYIGSSLSYGSNVQPIYWNEGIPTAITYTANRLYYAPTAESGAQFNTGEAYMPTNHYIDSEKIAINYSQGAPTETLYVNGNARIDGTISSNNDILPISNGASSLGTTDIHWSALYVGTNNSYGDPYTPIYWNEGIPEAVNMIQKANFSINETTTRCVISKTAYAANTIVLQIVIVSGKENLTSPITWEASNGKIQLDMETYPRGVVTGYILTARGIDLDQGV